MKWHFVEKIPASSSCSLCETGQLSIINIAKSSFQRPPCLLMIPRHKELITWGWREDGAGVKRLVVYWTQAWDNNKATHSKVANHILCFWCNYLKKRSVPPQLAVSAHPRWELWLHWWAPEKQGLGQPAIGHGPDPSTTLAVVNNTAAKATAQLCNPCTPEARSLCFCNSVLWSSLGWGGGRRHHLISELMDALLILLCPYLPGLPTIWQWKAALLDEGREDVCLETCHTYSKGLLGPWSVGSILGAACCSADAYKGHDLSICAKLDCVTYIGFGAQYATKSIWVGM